VPAEAPNPQVAGSVDCSALKPANSQLNYVGQRNSLRGHENPEIQKANLTGYV